MIDRFAALLLEKTEKGQTLRRAELERGDLMAGDVTVRVDYSTVNYKDGLALTGKAPVVRVWPLIPGIDFSGVVETSESPAFRQGERVVLNGWGVGETHHGGYAQLARVKADWLVALPDGISNRRAMAIGTAGYTAMLCVMELERQGLSPASGEVLVTGAAGGVGSIAVTLLSRLGYRVTASSGRAGPEGDFLRDLGAAVVIERSELSGPVRPLAKERWAGAVDVAGGASLANVLAQIRYGGAVAACGLAQSMDLPASVAPFILRGVKLAGVDSVMRPKSDRVEAWARLARDLDFEKLDRLSTTAPLADVPRIATEIVEGKVRGRVAIDVNA
ncbi:MAG: MDR family oxidoreductase [Caulobacteraceae bacterium]